MPRARRARACRGGELGGRSAARGAVRMRKAAALGLRGCRGSSPSGRRWTRPALTERGAWASPKAAGGGGSCGPLSPGPTLPCQLRLASAVSVPAPCGSAQLLLPQTRYLSPINTKTSPKRPDTASGVTQPPAPLPCGLMADP